MPYYINEKAKTSKRFKIIFINNNTSVYVIDKKDTDFNATFTLPNYDIAAFNGKGAIETKKFLTKALEFARKHLIEK